MIKVAYCNVKDLDLEKTYPILPESRQEKVDNFIFDKDKKLSSGVYLLLKKMLDEENIDDPIIETEKDGKPYISNYENIHFNMSHAGRMVACAISDEEIGIDIEKIDPLIDMKIAQTFFYNSEYDNIKKSDNRVDQFFKYWVLKESYMKYTGLGFLLDLDKFEIVIEDGETKVKNQNPELKENEDDVKFSYFDLNQYKLAICSENEADEILEYNLEDLY
jgi:4'-phosphopantetheinyl transferase